MKLEEKLVALRKEKGLTQLELAEMLNVSRQAVSRWEGGLAVPSLENLKYLGNLYNVPLEYLLSDNEGNCDINKHSREHVEAKENIDASKRIKNSILESYAKLYTLFLFVLLFLLEAIPGTVIMIPGYPYHTTIYRYSYCNIEPALRLNCAPFISFMLTVCCALLFLARGALINRAASIIANKVVLLALVVSTFVAIMMNFAYMTAICKVISGILFLEACCLCILEFFDLAKENAKEE